jgi:hypothetical protein
MYFTWQWSRTKSKKNLIFMFCWAWANSVKVHYSPRRKLLLGQMLANRKVNHNISRGEDIIINISVVWQTVPA